MAAVSEISSERPQSSVLSIASIMLSMACVGIGNGVMFAYEGDGFELMSAQVPNAGALVEDEKAASSSP